MTRMTKTVFALAILSVGLSLSTAASAATIQYANRTSFLSGISNAATDTFDSGYGFLNSEATMESLSAASINYSSTFHSAPDWNIVYAGTLCWGCNGSGLFDLSSTTIGTASGVYGFGVDITQNTGYNAFLTFGDNSMLDLDLIDGVSFLGFTSDKLIKFVEIAHSRGVTSGDGNFRIDNVTVGNAVPEPATFALLGIGLVGLSAMRPRKVL